MDLAGSGEAESEQKVSERKNESTHEHSLLDCSPTQVRQVVYIILVIDVKCVLMS